MHHARICITWDEGLDKQSLAQYTIAQHTYSTVMMDICIIAINKPVPYEINNVSSAHQLMLMYV